MADFKANRAELARILKGQSGTVTAALESVADRIITATGNPVGYERQTWVGRTRVRVTVRTVDPASAVAESRDHVLVRALGSVGRG